MPASARPPHVRRTISATKPADPDIREPHATRPAAHRVAVLVYDGVKLLDVAGPADVFAEANRLGARYDVRLVSPSPGGVTTSVGIRLAVDQSVASVDGIDTLVVPGADLYPRQAVAGELVLAAHDLAGRAARVACVCTGAFILAAAGRLDGRRATTHWKVADQLAQRHRSVRVEPDALYVKDGTSYTSAGVSAGIDLTLALVEEDLGADLAREVARRLVVYMQRAGGQSQFSTPLRSAPPRSPALRRVVDRVTADPSGDHSVGALAAALGVSTRHLTRLFHEEQSTTPARFVESLRLDLAKALLDQGYNATESAALAGFPSYESMRRVFAREIGVSPREHQRRFSTAIRAASPDRPTVVSTS